MENCIDIDPAVKDTQFNSPIDTMLPITIEKFPSDNRRHFGYHLHSRCTCDATGTKHIIKRISDINVIK